MNVNAKVLKKHRALLLPRDEDLERALPEYRLTPDQNNIVLPHTADVVRTIRRLGGVAPSPVHSRYDWAGTTPFLAQRATTAMLVCSPRAYVLNTMGTGKTRSVIYAWDYLRRVEKQELSMLIVAPLSTLNFVWLREIFMVAPLCKAVVVHGSKDKRRQLIESDADIHIINHDGVPLMLPELLARRFDIVVFDEVSVYRNARTKRFKAAAKVAERARYRWGLTGTPTPKAPTDAYGIIKLIDPHHPEVRSFQSFRDRLMTKQGHFKWVAKAGATGKVFDLMQPGVRFTLEECMDIPETTHGDREVKLSAEQLVAYKAMKADFLFAHEKGTVTAANAAVVLNKLVQIACGIVYDAKGETVDLKAHDRVKVAIEVLEDNDRKALVFVPVVSLVPTLVSALGKQGIAAQAVTGATPARQRAEIFHTFQTEPASKLKVIVAHPGTMSHGLTLTAANLILWYGPLDNLEQYQQANARTRRPGQTHHTQIIHLVGCPIERNVYKKLKQKEDLQSSLLELFE